MKTSYTYHAATRMWKGYETCLAAYGRKVCEVFMDRGGEDNTVDFFFDWPINDPFPYPWWFGMDAFHSAHRAALLAKDPTYYSQFGWTEKPKIEYWWPA
jgi:hypothetical protein